MAKSSYKAEKGIFTKPTNSVALIKTTDVNNRQAAN